MDDVAAIRATSGPWAKASLDRNWDALLGLCTDDVVFAPPGEPAVSGARVRSWLEAFPVMKVFEFTFDKIEVSGHLATGVGAGKWTLTIDGKDHSATFKFADVFRKNRDGEWRCAHVIWNTDAPGA